MSKTVARTLEIVCYVMTFFCGLAWLNNIHIALQWNPKNGHDIVYHGFISCLDWTAIDFSSVTTAVPFFGFLLMATGFGRIRKTEKGQEVSEYFPFFRSYIPVTVALGLIGTVWGLIMIGFYDPDKVRMQQLIMCLHTALFSTLIALTWVFLVVYPARYIMQVMHRNVTGYEERPGSDLPALLDSLASDTAGASKQIKAVSAEMGRLQQTTAGANTQLETAARLFKAVTDNIEGTMARTTQALEQMSTESKARQKAVEEMAKTSQQQQPAIQQLMEMVKRLKAELDQTRKERDQARAKSTKDEVEKQKAQEYAAKADAAKGKAEEQLDKVKKALND